MIHRCSPIDWLATVALAALLSGCATDRFAKMDAEFSEVQANCGLRGVILERDEKDRRLLRLVFRQRHNAELQAQRNGSLGCIEHWAHERGYRITSAPAGGSY